MPQPKFNRAMWSWGILGTVLGGTLVAIIVNFVVLPARDRMRERTELARTVDRQELRIANIETWQTSMQAWKENIIGATGITSVRQAMKSMPAPHQPADTGR